MAAFWLTEGLSWIRGLRRMPVLQPASDAVSRLLEHSAFLAIIVPACNEEATIGSAMRSILAHLPETAFVVAVDDRSTDGTGAALDALSGEDGRLRVLHVRELPPGWLGKTHALHCGARYVLNLWKAADLRQAWLLFTDADVHYAAGAIPAAVEHATRNGLDHLAVMPRLISGSLAETAFVAAFLFVFGLAFRVWKVNDPASNASVGVGAFNLVRADAYKRIGGHARLRMDVVDDMRLGQELRAAGARQGVAIGFDLLAVRWHDSLIQHIGGLEKNAFAGLHYSVLRLLWATAGLLLLCAPYAGVALLHGWERWVCAGALCMVAGVYCESERHGGAPWPYFATLPVGVALFLAAMWRSAIMCLWKGGIVWRGTFYPLAELRASRSSPGPAGEFREQI